ncbi:hypothetical protein B0H13DRAFT_2348413 [Mycena leptocephala]|nr:hypothetical protein B0H13DRAFT_2348413 [Mycena leptocephala]
MGWDVVEDAKSLVVILDQIKAPALTRLNTEDDTPSLAFSPALQASASHLDLPEPENRKRAVDTVTSLSRDSLALRTGTSRPFASLQRRRRRSPRADCSCSSPPRRPARSRPQTIVLLMIRHQKNPRTRGRDRPSVPPTSPSRPWTLPTTIFCVLTGSAILGFAILGRALSALGWIRPG